MSNEYKDWERDRIEEEKILAKEYPFIDLLCEIIELLQDIKAILKSQNR